MSASGWKQSLIILQFNLSSLFADNLEVANIKDGGLICPIEVERCN